MGWSYRKSVGIGPFRINLSKSGIGYSVGGMGFRTGVSAGGRKYKSFTIPGTGVRYQSSSKQGCLLLLGLLSGLATVATLLLARILP
jgi:hypothetical protein